MSCPFEIGSSVTWNSRAPKTWHMIHTPGPMEVVAVIWDDGDATEFSMQFSEAPEHPGYPRHNISKGGIPRKPGWIVTVEYDADSTGYYHPPLSLLLGSKRIQTRIHEMWLIQA